MPENIGEFFGNFANSFSRVSAQNKEQKRLDEMAKIQGKLLQLQLEAKQGQLDAQTTVSDMMSGVGPGDGSLFGLEQTQPTQSPGGRDLLQLGSEGPGPMNAEQMIDSPQGLSALMASGQLEPLLGLAQEDRLSQAATDRQANIDRIFGSGNNIPVDAAGNPQFLMAPGIGANGEITATPILNANYQLPTAAATEANELQTTFTRIQKAISDNYSLHNAAPLQASGSPLRGGASLGSRGVGAVARTFGFDSPFPEAEDAAAVQVALNKSFAVQMFSSGELDLLLKEGRITVTQWNQLKTANPDMNNRWDVNARIQLDGLQLKLDNADILGIPATNKKEIQEYIDSMNAVIDSSLDLNKPDDGSSFIDPIKEGFGNAAAAAAPALESVREFARMSFDKLKQTDFKALSGEAKAAALERWDQFVSELPIEQIEDMGAELQGMSEEQVAAVRKRYEQLKKVPGIYKRLQQERKDRENAE